MTQAWLVPGHGSSCSPSWYTPTNGLLFFAWAAGEVGWFFPYQQHRGGE